MHAGRIIQQLEESGGNLSVVATGLTRAANGQQAFDVLVRFLQGQGFTDATLTVEASPAAIQWDQMRWSTLSQDRVSALDAIGFGGQDPVHRLARRSLDPFVWTTSEWPGEEADADCCVMRDLEALGVSAGMTGAVWGRAGRLAVIDAFGPPEHLLGLSAWEREAFHLAATMTFRAIERASSAAGGAALTRRETQILDLASQGMTMRLIAHQLDIVEATVKFHLKSIRAKLNARNTPEAIARFAALDVRAGANGWRPGTATGQATGQTC